MRRFCLMYFTLTSGQTDRHIHVDTHTMRRFWLMYFLKWRSRVFFLLRCSGGSRVLVRVCWPFSTYSTMLLCCESAGAK